MKVLFLTSRLPYPPHRGDKLKIYNLIRQLAGEHDITLLSFIASGDESRYVPELEKICKRVITVHLPSWRSVVNCLFAVFSLVPFQVAYFASGAMRRRASEEIGSGKFDLVHVHLIRMAQYAPRNPGAPPRILDLTDAGSLYLERFLAITRSMVKKILVRLELTRLSSYERILEQFDVSLVCSEIDRQALLRHAPKASIDLLYNGIDLDYFAPVQCPEPVPDSLICTGNMSYFPNEDGMVYFVQEILPLVRKKIPSVTLSIVGQNPTAKVRRLQGPGILVTGFVADIKEYYLKSALAIAPVRFGAGTLNKVLEPMALGIPVVTTSIGVEGLPLQNGRDIVIADTAEEFADSIVRLLTGETLRKTIALSGQKVVRDRYDWKIIARRLGDIYRSATGQKVV